MGKRSKKQRYEISKVGKHYHQLFRDVEKYLTRGEPAKIKKLYNLLRMNTSPRCAYVYSFSNAEQLMDGLHEKLETKSIIVSYLSKLRELRRDMQGEEVHSRFAEAMSGLMVKVGDRVFSPIHNIRWVARSINEWRPNLIGNMTAAVSLHTSNNNCDLKVGRLTMTPHEADERKNRHQNYSKDDDKYIPLVATDRFIMWFAGGIPDKICDGDDHRVVFISDDSAPRLVVGWLSKHGTEFGCAVSQKDARKAAKMRAVRKAKKALGLI